MVRGVTGGAGGGGPGNIFKIGKSPGTHTYMHMIIHSYEMAVIKLLSSTLSSSNSKTFENVLLY